MSRYQGQAEDVSEKPKRELRFLPCTRNSFKAKKEK
jgi:hypothetical protein